MSGPYKRPPITEAVIELKFAQEVEDDLAGKLRERMAEYYPLPFQSIQTYSTEVKGDGIAMTIETVGFRLTGSSGDEIATVGPKVLSASQLAPYVGWDNFVRRFIRDWKLWVRMIGRKPVSRLGVRFINRLDIPYGTAHGMVIEDYLNVFGSMPGALNLKARDYLFKISSKFGPEDDWDLTLAVARVPAALLDHWSILLDIDIGRPDVGTADHELERNLSEARALKNAVFEACVTDRSREIFNK